MRIERVDVRIDLVQVEEIRVLLVCDDLEPVGAGLVRDRVTRGLLGRPNEVVATPGLTMKETRNWYTGQSPQAQLSVGM